MNQLKKLKFGWGKENTVDVYVNQDIYKTIKKGQKNVLRFQ